jgi:single-strand DNA-binding protein
MAGSINKVTLIGNVGRNPEVKVSKNGDSVATFSLATTYSYRPQGGERVDNTEWHRIVAWRNLADQASKYITKGRKVYVEGRIQSRQYTDQGGQQRTAYEIVATQIEFLDSLRDQNGGGQPSPANDAASTSFVAKSPRAAGRQSEEDFDDIPF